VLQDIAGRDYEKAAARNYRAGVIMDRFVPDFYIMAGTFAGAAGAFSPGVGEADMLVANAADLIDTEVAATSVADDMLLPGAPCGVAIEGVQATSPLERFLEIMSMPAGPRRGRAVEEVMQGLGNPSVRYATPGSLRITDATGGGFLNFSDQIYDFELKVFDKPVALSGRIYEELGKDIWLMAENPSYHPVWVFVKAGPTKGLRATLEFWSIPYQVW
jgi:hypothetical protein